MNKLRARQFMYMQDLKHLNIDLSSLKEILNKSPCPEWAYIVHDQDLNKKGKKIRPHVHVVLKYSNPQLLKTVAHLFHDKEQYVQVWHGRINNAYSYLLHLTDSATGKYQYDPNLVVASFDFRQRIKEIKSSIVKGINKGKLTNIFLNEYANNQINFKELEESIGTLQVAKKKTVIDHIDELKAMQKHEKWLKSFAGQRMECIWLWGKTGVGKSRYARWLTRNDKTAFLGSSRDYFQEYHGEKFVVLNDLRPNDFKYSDLLRLLDPFEHDKMAPRRYHDVPLNIEMLIITTPYSPWEFYKNSQIDDYEVDTFEQLRRRVLSINVTPKFIKEMMPHDKSEGTDEWEGFA